MIDLLSLAARVEREPPSFTLDKDILRAFGFTWRGMGYWAENPHRQWKGGPTDFTSSLDSAVTLIPTGWIIERMSDTAMGPPGNLTADGCKVELVNDAHAGPCAAQGNAATRAATLTAACLRARAAIATLERLAKEAGNG